MPPSSRPSRLLPFALAWLIVQRLAAADTAASAGVDASSMWLSADGGLAAVFVDGVAVPAGAHAADWTTADDIGARRNLRCLAVSAVAEGGMGDQGGFIGAIALADGRFVPTDRTWRAWAGAGDPANDTHGRAWTDPDFDDAGWDWATEVGPYGIGPWGTDTQGPGRGPAGSKLDAAMRRVEVTGKPLSMGEQLSAQIPPGAMLPAGTPISALVRGPACTRLNANATWIWAGPGLHPAPRAFFRKTFAGGAGTPPTRPADARVAAVTPTSFTLSWRPSFAPQGPVSYRVVWNGLPMSTTADTSCTISGLSINTVPQNYAYVRAIATDGSESDASAFVLVALPDTLKPQPPAHLRVLRRARDGFDLAWDPAVDDGRIESYFLVVGSTLVIVPGTVTAITVADGTAYPPGTAVKIRAQAQDGGGNRSDAAVIEAWTLPETEQVLEPPRELAVGTNGTVITWKASATPGATAYRAWFDGVPASDPVTGTTLAIPESARSAGYVRLAAIDGHGNESAPTPALQLGNPSTPSVPIVSDAGRGTDGVWLRWTRPAPGTCVGYRIEREESGVWKPAASIDDPWQDRGSVTGLQPGSAVRLRVVALPPHGAPVASAPITLDTISPPAAKPVTRFAVLVSTDGRYDNLAASLEDAAMAHCAFALVKGQLVPQLTGDEQQWVALMKTVDAFAGRLPVILSPLSVKDTYSSVQDPSDSWALADWGQIANPARYDMFTRNTRQPLDQLHRELDGSLHLAALTENWRSNPAFSEHLETWLQEADADGSCRWFFTSGLVPESDPIGIGGVMLNLYGPSVEFMRMINGDRGHELAWFPGSAVATACPQRNRAGGHYLVTVEPRRLVLESRQRGQGGAFATDGVQEILYDRAANQIAAANVRMPHPVGIAVGLPAPSATDPAWTQNRVVSGAVGAKIPIRLLGRSPRGAPITFTIVRKPAHGALDGAGADRSYRPEPGFTGEDSLLYRADDGGPSPGNTGWVRIRVGQDRPPTLVKPATPSKPRR